MTDVLTDLKALLWEWDPIGVKGLAPSDEYDAYAPELLVLLRRGDSVEEIKAYLDWLERDYIGLSRSGGQTADIARRAEEVFHRKRPP